MQMQRAVCGQLALGSTALLAPSASPPPKISAWKYAVTEQRYQKHAPGAGLRAMQAPAGHAGPFRSNAHSCLQ